MSQSSLSYVACAILLLSCACGDDADNTDIGLNAPTNNSPNSYTPNNTQTNSNTNSNNTSSNSSANATTAPANNLAPPGQDNDGDGLEDRWEQLAGDQSLLDWTKADTDGDGTPDGEEDLDGDGLSNLQEWICSQYESLPANNSPHPLRKDLFIELDAMRGFSLEDNEISEISAAYLDAPIENIDGSTGIGIHFYPDELNIEPVDFDGSFEQRHNFLKQHGAKYTTKDNTPPLPAVKFIHLVIASRRSDAAERGGEAVAHADGDVEKSGVFLYVASLSALHPQCGRETPPLPDITLTDAKAGTVIHELGHALQLGHDTETGGGINTYNVMAVPSSCFEAHHRFFGISNTNEALGATEEVGRSRFSKDAVDLMRFDRKLSADTSKIANDDKGFEM